MKINTKIITYFLGFLLLINGGFMFLSALLSYIYKDGITGDLILSGTIVSIIGLLMLFLNKNHDKQINKREGYLVVVLGWVIMIFSGTIPYILTGTIEGFSNIFFETTSGYTATGATIIKDVEILPEGIIDFFGNTTDTLNYSFTTKKRSDYGKIFVNLSNISFKPIIIDLINFLKSGGATIKFIGKRTVRIEGVKILKSTIYSVMSDRIETGTFCVAACLTGGNLKINNFDPKIIKGFLYSNGFHVFSVTNKLVSLTILSLTISNTDSLYC